MRMKHVFVWVTPLYQPRLNGIAKYAHAHGWHLTIADRIGYNTPNNFYIMFKKNTGVSPTQYRRNFINLLK